MKLPDSIQNSPPVIIFAEVYELASKHKKTAIIVIIGELWVHSLVFSHMGELKSVMQLIPFLGN